MATLQLLRIESAPLPFTGAPWLPGPAGSLPGSRSVVSVRSSRDYVAAHAHLPLRPRQVPPARPRPSTTGFKPVTLWASNAASVVDAFNTCAAEPEASASLSAARASASDASRCVSEEATACFSACSTHSRQRCFPTPLASCVRLNASAASVFPHAEHTCCSVGGGGGGGGSAFGPSVGTGATGNVSATEAFAACFAAATARSSAAAASTHSLQRIGACSSLRALSSILLEKTAAINRFRPHGPAQLNSDAHDMGPHAARTSYLAVHTIGRDSELWKLWKGTQD